MQNQLCNVMYQVPQLKISDTRYPIFLKIVWYEPNTDTDNDIITARIISILV